jgi:hypothetical protein
MVKSRKRMLVGLACTGLALAVAYGSAGAATSSEAPATEAPTTSKTTPKADETLMHTGVLVAPGDEANPDPRDYFDPSMLNGPDVAIPDDAPPDAVDEESGDPMTLAATGRKREFQNIERTWGKISSASIYWEADDRACCIRMTIKDKCPGDGKMVMGWAQIDVNNQPDILQMVGDTNGHSCGWVGSFVRGDYASLTDLRKARIQMCRSYGDASGWSCTTWGPWVDNPLANP